MVDEGHQRRWQSRREDPRGQRLRHSERPGAGAEIQSRARQQRAAAQPRQLDLLSRSHGSLSQHLRLAADLDPRGDGHARPVGHQPRRLGPVVLQLQLRSNSRRPVADPLSDPESESKISGRSERPVGQVPTGLVGAGESGREPGLPAQHAHGRGKARQLHGGLRTAGVSRQSISRRLPGRRVLVRTEREPHTPQQADGTGWRDHGHQRLRRRRVFNIHRRALPSGEPPEWSRRGSLCGGYGAWTHPTPDLSDQLFAQANRVERAAGSDRLGAHLPHRPFGSLARSHGAAARETIQSRPDGPLVQCQWVLERYRPALAGREPHVRVGRGLASTGVSTGLKACGGASPGALDTRRAGEVEPGNPSFGPRRSGF